MNARLLRNPVIGLLLLLCAGAALFVAAGCARINDPRPAGNPQLVPVVIQPASSPLGEELPGKYPFESLASRLEYETKRPAATVAASLSESSRNRLVWLELMEESEYRDSPRRRALLTLHASEAKDFVEREGFGYSRMRPTLKLPEVEPIALAQVSSQESIPGPWTSLPRDDSAAANIALGLPPAGGLTFFHQTGLLNFVNLQNAGLVKNRERVAGFRSHQFSKMPSLNENPVGLKPRERWQVRRLELVSLLKYEKPAVYLSDNLLRMDELKKAPTRSLTAFEEQALQSLRGGEDLSIEASLNHIRMVGALRATKTCLNCHHGKRGELLGAFSHLLERNPPIKAAAN